MPRINKEGERKKGMLCLLNLAKVFPLELYAFLGDIDPQAAMTADARGALDCKADSDGIARLWGDINVFAGDLGRPVVVQG